MYIIVSILFLIQLFLVYSYYFRTGWDSYTVSDNAIYYSDNQSVVDVWYYGTYPNNIFITRFIASLITIAKFFKISGSHFFISVFFMVILNTLTGILIYKISSKIYTNNKVSLVVYILPIISWIFSLDFNSLYGFFRFNFSDTHFIYLFTYK